MPNYILYLEHVHIRMYSSAKYRTVATLYRTQALTSLLSSNGVSYGSSACGVMRAKCRRWPFSQSNWAECVVTRFCSRQLDRIKTTGLVDRILTSHTTTVPGAQRTRAWKSCEIAMWLYRKLSRWSDSSFLKPTIERVTMFLRQPVLFLHAFISTEQLTL